MSYYVDPQPFLAWLDEQTTRERRLLLAECPEIYGDWHEIAVKREVRTRLAKRLGVPIRTLHDFLHKQRKRVSLDTVDRMCGPLVLNELYPVNDDECCGAYSSDAGCCVEDK